jgi:hypothetical protein
MREEPAPFIVRDPSTDHKLGPHVDMNRAGELIGTGRQIVRQHEPMGLPRLDECLLDDVLAANQHDTVQILVFVAEGDAIARTRHDLIRDEAMVQEPDFDARGRRLRVDSAGRQ